MEQDEQTLTLVLPNVTSTEKLNPTTSQSTLVQGIPWRLVAVSQEVTSSSQGGKPRTLGVFLKCKYDSPEEVWSVSAHATIKLVNHANPENSYLKVFDHEFSRKSTDWGYSSFMKWKDVVDPSKGFIKDDSIVLVSQIKVTRKSMDTAVGAPSPSLSSVLSCPICYKDFLPSGKMQPLSLMCGHSFCVECLQKKSVPCDDGNVKISCTLCNQDNIAPTENKLWFPNHAMIQVISAGVVPKAKNLCPTHQHEKSYYCFDDRTLVCIYCAYHGDHSKHKCLHVDTARQELDCDLQKYKQQVMSKLSEVERKLLLKTNERKLLQSQQSSIVKAVGDFFAELSSILVRQKDSLLQELDTHSKSMDCSLEQTVNALREKSSEINMVLKEYSTWQNLSPHEALTKVSGVQRSLQSAGEATVNIDNMPTPLTKITFEMPSYCVLSSLEHLGRLKFESTTPPTDDTFQSASQKSFVDNSEPPAKRKKAS